MADHVEFSTGAETHLDADTLTAFAEQALSEGQNVALFAHLADCEQCRERLRLQAYLRGEAALPAAAIRESARLSAPRFRTAAAFVCALLSGIILLLWTHGAPSVPITNTTDLPKEAWLVSRTAPSLNGGRPKREESVRAIPPQSENRRFGVSVSSNPQTASRRIGRMQSRHEARTAGSWVFSNSSHPPELRGHAVAYSLPRSRALWESVRFQTERASLTSHAEPTVASLPGPFVTAHLKEEMNFGSASRDGNQEVQIQRGHSIAITTALGERRFYWNGLLDKSVVVQ